MLALAFVFAGVWARSYVIRDCFQVGKWIGPLSLIESDWGELSLVKFPGAPTDYAFWDSDAVDVPDPANFDFFTMADLFIRKSNYSLQTSATTYQGYGLIIPYWNLVIPLTLLSAWLLLSKPRTNETAT